MKLNIENFIFPESCVICGVSRTTLCKACTLLFEGAHLKCLRCGKRNPLGRYCPKCKTKNSPERVIAIFKYDGEAKELVHKMKYEDCHSLAQPLGKLIANNLKKIDDIKSYAVTFVPVHKSRKYYRGYNQAELLAQKIAYELDLDCLNLLYRNRKTQSQIDFASHDDRRQNINNSIEAQDMSPDKIILIDDVITSGATIEESSKILHKAGAKNIIAAAVCLG